MESVVAVTVGVGTSPRSAVLSGSHYHMNTPAVTTNKNNMTSNGDGEEHKLPASSTEVSDLASPAGENATSSKASAPAGAEKSRDEKDQDPQLSPMPQIPTQHLQAYAANMTPVAAPGYYLGYPQSQVTPESPSPGGGTGAYDVGTFFQPGAFGPHASPFTAAPNIPLSPPRVAATSPMVGVPSSPLLPRVSGAVLGGATGMDSNLVRQQNPGAPPSPGLPYFGASSSYPTYAIPPVGSQSNNSAAEGSWGERNQGQQTAYASPQLTTQGVPVQYGVALGRPSAGERGGSFDESVIVQSSTEQHEQNSPAYPAYNTNQSAAQGGSMFSHQPHWTYGGPPDMYSDQGSPIQPRPTAHPQLPMYPGPMAPGMRPMPSYGQFYSSSSPGPPIQMTSSNKGPDGANLFIFHIPNHFTNVDMYQLFCPYGNLLSVRIMVEKDSGRSRGFGFVSYDNPESAAQAIKELNGYAIGNKRLKVQHKQIRPKDMQDREGAYGYTGSHGDATSHSRPQFSSPLPPAGPMSVTGPTGISSTFYVSRNTNMMLQHPPQQPARQAGGNQTPQQVNVGVGASVVEGQASASDLDKSKHQDEGTEQTSTSTNAETSLQLGGVDGGGAAGTNSTPAAMSPLSTLGSLQNALPDVPGNSASE